VGAISSRQRKSGLLLRNLSNSQYFKRTIRPRPVEKPQLTLAQRMIWAATQAASKPLKDLQGEWEHHSPSHSKEAQNAFCSARVSVF
jgi:hypothetical protein